jgi:tetratricopeptide (TPR) repeat protein
MKLRTIIIAVAVLGFSTSAYADETTDGTHPCYGWKSGGAPPDSIIAACTQLIDAGTDGDLPLAYKVRGSAYEAKGDDAHALADFDKVVELSPGSYLDLLYREATNLNDDGAYSRAIVYYSEAIRIRPDYAEAFLGRGNAYYGQNDYAHALVDFDSAVALVPQSYIYYDARCGARLHLGDLDKALTDCNTSLGLRDKYETHGTRGLVYLKQGKFAEARADFDAAVAGAKLEADPPPAYAIYGRGLARLRLGDKSGKADIANAKKLSPKAADEFIALDLKP